MNMQPNPNVHTEYVTYNDQLLGFIEKFNDGWCAVVCGDEIVCDTREEAIKAVYDINCYY
jgi:hypothetical protein